MNTFKKNIFITTVTLCAVISVSTLTFAADKAQESAAKYRQNTFNMINYHASALGAMLKGRVTFDTATFTKHAEAIVALSQLTPMGFEVEGATIKSRAKEAIWKNKKDFSKKIIALQTASVELVEVAKSGDEKEARRAFRSLGKSCTACHSEYRGKRKKDKEDKE